MVDCNKCIFSKCCKDVNAKRKDCSYYHEQDSLEWVESYLKHRNLWKDDYDINDPTNECFACALNNRREEAVDLAKFELMNTFKITVLVLFSIVSIVALFVGDASRWSAIYLQIIACIFGTILVVGAICAVWSFCKYIFGNIKTIVRGG